MASRLAELGRLGVSGVRFEGPARVRGLDVLGKGHSGVVVLARAGGRARAAALKIRRLDSPRRSMLGEARLLGAANKAGVGPALAGASRNFLVMELAEGRTIGSWMAGGGPAGAAEARRAAKAVLEDCYRLDAAGLDHGELSRIHRHAVVGGGGRTAVVDFEGASAGRRASNVTSAAQGMFIGSGMAEAMGRLGARPEKGAAVRALRAYKSEGTRESFEGVLGALGLSPRGPPAPAERGAVARHLSGRDGRLAAVVGRVGEYRMRRARNRYESLVLAVIGQQLSGAAAGAAAARFRALYGGRFPRPGAVAATPEAALRGAGLSGMKAAAIAGLSARIESGALRLDALPRMPDEDVVGELSAVRGVGRWTAQMFLMFALGRLDVLPAGDLGLRRGIMLLRSAGRLPSEAEAEREAEAWRPYRSAATWYLWRWQAAEPGMLAGGLAGG